MENDVRRPTTMADLAAGPVEYRLERREGPVVVVFHGGHMRAGLALGESVFAAAGCTVLVASRPGYGRTPLSTGTTPGGFSDVVRALCARLGIGRIAAVIGVSGGGPTAVTMAVRHRDVVERLILISAVGELPWPDRHIRAGARVFFDPAIQGLTWEGVHLLARRAPATCLRLMLSSLSTRPVAEVVSALSAVDRSRLLELFAAMASGRGFRNDLAPVPAVAAQVEQPTLVIATRNDGGVPFAHAQTLCASISGAELVESQAASHFVWFSPDWPVIAARIGGFLPPAAQ